MWADWTRRVQQQTASQKKVRCRLEKRAVVLVAVRVRCLEAMRRVNDPDELVGDPIFKNAVLVMVLEQHKREMASEGGVA